MMTVDLVIVYLQIEIELLSFSERKEEETYKATSTNSSPHCENPMSTAPKNEVGATFLITVETGSFTLCLPVKIL